MSRDADVWLDDLTARYGAVEVEIRVIPGACRVTWVRAYPSGEVSDRRHAQGPTLHEALATAVAHERWADAQGGSHGG